MESEKAVKKKQKHVEEGEAERKCAHAVRNQKGKKKMFSPGPAFI